MQTLPIQGLVRADVLAALRDSTWFRALQRQAASAPGAADPLDQIIDSALAQSYAAGEAIVRQGEPSDAFYILVKGRATARLGAEGVEGTHMDPPATFGEVGLLLHEPRTATVVADEDVLCLRMESAAFRRLFQTVPDFGLETSRHLAARLRSVSDRLV